MKVFGYGKQHIFATDVDSVDDVLMSDFLTCGPKVKEFEDAVCDFTGAKYAVAVSSATAGLHIAMLAAGIKNGDEEITTPITFIASSNAGLYVGADVRFADIDEKTANISPAEIEKQITSATKVIVPVHFAGQSCDMLEISKIAKKNNLIVIEDAAHAIGSLYNGEKVGSCRYSDMTVFSFHPVKTITSGEGGMVTTNSEELYHRLCAFRAHGTFKDGDMTNTWEYEMRELGYNYRMTDIQAALGLAQLSHLAEFKAKRRYIVDYYNRNLGLPHLTEEKFSDACFHLYPVLVENRKDFYFKAKTVGLNLQVHYIPVHLQPYYVKKFGYKKGDYPNAEKYYEHCISLPLYYDLTDTDLAEIVKRIKSILP